MNKARRAQIVEALVHINEVKEGLETICEEEQEYYDNMPESLQSGEKGSMSEQAIDCLNDAIGSLEDASGQLDAIE